MTQAELDSLPEHPGSCGFGQVERIIDGRKVVVPVAPRLVAMFRKDDDPVYVVSSNGKCYTVGWIDGVRVKSQVPCHWEGLDFGDEA